MVLGGARYRYDDDPHLQDYFYNLAVKYTYYNDDVHSCDCDLIINIFHVLLRQFSLSSRHENVLYSRLA